MGTYTSDDLDTYKEVADALGIEHQVCRNHVKRNVDAVADSIRDRARPDEDLPVGVDSSSERLPGERHSIGHRVRMLITRLWDGWRRLTLDQRRDDLDGTNNSSERLMGWWIKERYRLMRGYKCTEPIKNVVTLTARMGVRSGCYDMAELYMHSLRKTLAYTCSHAYSTPVFPSLEQTPPATPG